MLLEGVGDRRSARINEIACRYQTMVEHCCPALSIDQWRSLYEFNSKFDFDCTGEIDWDSVSIPGRDALRVLVDSLSRVELIAVTEFLSQISQFGQFSESVLTSLGARISTP